MNIERIEEVLSDYDKAIANPDGSGMEGLQFDFGMCATIDPDGLRELLRLARLGLRVEGAPTTVCTEWTEVIGRPPFDSYKMVGRCPCPLELAGKRVALVVVE